jgi:hypothetical protein
VAVVGDGAVGLCGVIAAKRLGAEQIIVMGRHADRDLHPWSRGRYRTTAGMSAWPSLRSKPSASRRALISTLTVPSPFFVTGVGGSGTAPVPGAVPRESGRQSEGGDRGNAADGGKSTSGPSRSPEVAAPAGICAGSGGRRGESKAPAIPVEADRS